MGCSIEQRGIDVVEMYSIEEAKEIIGKKLQTPEDFENWEFLGFGLV